MKGESLPAFDFHLPLNLIVSLTPIPCHHIFLNSDTIKTKSLLLCRSMSMKLLLNYFFWFWLPHKPLRTGEGEEIKK
jgi:hypothetical protein